MAAVDLSIEQTTPAFSAGDVLDGKFVLRRPLAAGGSGEVWVATNRATRGVVAIKLVRKASPIAAARFRQEAELSAALAHRNVVRVYDYFEEQAGALGLVMECLRGETARERLDRAGPLVPRAAVAVATQVLAGLAHAHELRIVHRDIKPPNLFLATDPDGSTTTKILDFGIARTPTNTVHTLHGQLLGTPRYMSPEQIRAEPSLDGRSDFFSLAAVLYELLTGQAPFAAAFATASLALVLEKRVERDERIPEPLWAVLEKALSKDPNERPATAKAFADALRTAVVAGDGALALELHRSRPPPPMMVGEETNSPLIVSRPTTTTRTRSVAARRLGPRATYAVVAAVAACAAVISLAALRAVTRHPEDEGTAVAATAPIASPPPTQNTTSTSNTTSASSSTRPPVAAPAPAPEPSTLPTPFSLVPKAHPPAAPRRAARASTAPAAPAAPRANPAGIVKDPGF